MEWSAGRIVKTVSLILFLVAATVFFDQIGTQIKQKYDLVLSPTAELRDLALKLFVAMILAAVTAGLAATLIRPLWLCLTAFGLSAAALVCILGLEPLNVIAAIVYLLLTWMYVLEVANGMDERIHFSVKPIAEVQTFLMLALLLVIGVCFYSGYADEIRLKGFSIPEPILNMWDVTMAGIQKMVMGEGGAAPKPEELAKIRQALQEQVTQQVRPYEPYIPVLMTISLLWMLYTAVSLLSWVPILILRLVFPMLAALRVTTIITEDRQVQRVTLS